MGTVTTFGLNELNNSINTNGFYLGDLEINQAQIGRVNSMIGGIAGEAAGSLIDKDFSLNVLNLADIMALAGVEEENTSDLGLFEVHMGFDEEGNFTSHSKIGTGGAQISYRDILFDADTVFNNMARIQSINDDTEAAAANRDTMLGIEGRVLDNNDIDFTGRSEIAGLLLYQLDETRSSKSYENLVNLFESTDRLGESYLDSQLAKALDMGDLKGERMLYMLRDQAFNTTGSYDLAEKFFDEGRGLTAFADVKLGESGFDSGYYIKSQYESGTEAVLEDAFNGIVNWFAEDENGNSIIGNANDLLGGDVFDAENHITEMLYSGDFRSIENNLLQIGNYSRILYDAMDTIVNEINGSSVNDRVNEKLGRFAAGLATFKNYLAEHPEIGLDNIEIADFDHEANTCYDEESGYYLPFSISGADDRLYIYTKEGYDYVDVEEAAATGREVGSLRKHEAVDVGMRINETDSRYQLAVGDMDISLYYDNDGLWVNSLGGFLKRETTHNTARSLEFLTRAVLGGNGTVNDNGTIHIDAGYVIGQSGLSDNGYDSVTGPSTGPHSHEITSIKNIYGRYEKSSTWLKNTFSDYVTVTQDAAVFSGIQKSNPVVGDEYLRVKYLWDNRDINSNYFDDYMESKYGIDNADWQDYLKAYYWENYTIYMQGMGN